MPRRQNDSASYVKPCTRAFEMFQLNRNLALCKRDWCKTGGASVSDIFAPVVRPGGAGREVDFEVGGSRGRGCVRGRDGGQQA